MSERKSLGIIFVTPGFSEPGGCASHGRKIAEGLAALGWRVDVVTRLASGRTFRRVESGSLRVTEIPGFGRRRLGGALFLMVALPIVILRRRPYGFMAMQLSSPATVAAVGAIVHRCRPLLVFSTSTGPRGEASFIRNSRLSWLRRLVLSRASTLIAQTESAACELRELVKGPVAVIPTPVDVPEQLAPLRGNKAVVYTGRIVQGKNLDLLLDVWREVIADIPNATLTLVGSGTHGDDLEDELRRAIHESSELSRSVSLTGWVVDVSPYLNASDVYVFPSDSEGMSNALLEACSHGLVVVASDIPANRAVLGDDYPLLVTLSHSGEFKHVLMRSLTDDRLRTAARTQILERLPRFRDSAVVGQIEALLGSQE